MNEYQIHRYHPDLKDQVLDLQKHHWGSQKQLNAAYLKWKYDQNPNAKGTSIYVAMQKDQVVGMLGMCGGKWEFGEERHRFPAPIPADAVVDPQHRRHGLFRQMMYAQMKDLEDQGVRHAFALSVGSLSYPGFLQMGWRSIGPVGTMGRLVGSANKKIDGSSGLLMSTVRKLRIALASSADTEVAHALDREAVKRKRDIARFISVEKQPRPQAMAELLERIGHDGRIRHVRDEEYLAWRFKNPFSRYRFLFWRHNALEGYLALQFPYHKLKVSAEIVDWEATDSTIRRDLLLATILLTKGIDLKMWSATAGEDAQTLLQETGFQPIPSKGNADCPVFIRPVSEKVNDTDWYLGSLSMLEWRNWDLRWVYSDHCG